MPLLVQNEVSNRTVFSKSIAGSVQTFIWGPKDSPLGDDIQRVPDAIADDVDFLNSLDRGTLSIVSSDSAEIAERIQQSASVISQRRAAAEARVAEAVDARSGRDMLGVQCLGPSLNGLGQCDQQVIVPAKQRDEEPPLCGRHKSLLNQFALHEVGSRGDESNLLRKEWVRAEMTPRARG